MMMFFPPHFGPDDGARRKEGRAGAVWEREMSLGAPVAGRPVFETLMTPAQGVFLLRVRVCVCVRHRTGREERSREGTEDDTGQKMNKLS